MSHPAERIREQAAELRRQGCFQDAVAELQQAVERWPDGWPLWHDLGLALGADGRPAEAVHVLRRAIALGGGEHAASWVNLGNALRSSGHKAQALEAFAAAIVREPRLAAAYFNQHAALYDDRDGLAAEQALARAFALRPDHLDTRFYLGALRRLHGRGGEELLESLPSEAVFLLESLRFVEAERGHHTRLFSDTFDTLGFALSRAPPHGLVIELGVRHGTSLRFLAGRCAAAVVYGFDSFEGLPTGWGGAPVGLYSTGGAAPEVAPNVQLHCGRFRDTIGPMLSVEPGAVRLLHVDCDLYASTAEALEPLAGRIAPGTVVVFDEYLCNPGWRNEEHAAWCEVAHDHRLRFEYLAFSLFTKQAVVRVTAVG